MPCKALAAVGLSVLLAVAAGCASPTPAPTPSVYAAGLGYASAEGLEAATYAAAYEGAYTSQINDGATEEEARRHAAALADAALGS